MKPDIKKYMPYMDEFDMTQEEKVEYIQSIWNFLQSYADLAFGIHPSQLIQKERERESQGSGTNLNKEKYA